VSRPPDDPPLLRALNALALAAGANFFGRVADVMEAFLDIEAEALAIDAIAARDRACGLRRVASEVRHRSAAALSRKSAWPNRK